MAGIITWNVKVSAWETILMHRIQQQCPSMMKFCKKSDEMNAFFWLQQHYGYSPFKTQKKYKCYVILKK